MKTIFALTIFVAICALQGSAQLLLRTTTQADISAISLGTDLKNANYGENMNLDQSFYYRKKYNSESKEKTVYNKFSVYKRDSMIGFCPYGIDIDMMSEVFEKNRSNTFRYWNKLRLGFALLIEKNPDRPDYSGKKMLNYINAEIYMSYLHIPHQARGDRTTKMRQGSVMIYGAITPSFRIDAFIKVKPIGSTWIKGYFYQAYGNPLVGMYGKIQLGPTPRVGICTEIEVNKNGYNKTRVYSSKDVYRGFTLICGPDYNIKSKEISLRVGIKFDMRNH